MSSKEQSVDIRAWINSTGKELLVINFKNYEEIANSQSLKLAQAASAAARRHNIKIVVCPPNHLISEVAKISIPVFAQHVDNAKVGSTTGFVVPELLKKSNVQGSLVNHSEHRISPKEVEEIVARLRSLGMTSVVCVRDTDEAERYARFGPDYIAIEPPELIGSGKAVSMEKPEVITGSVSAVKSAKNHTRLLCGAGIVTGADVSKALDLGADGILVASGIVKAKNWENSIEEFALAFTNSGKI